MDRNFQPARRDMLMKLAAAGLAAPNLAFAADAAVAPAPVPLSNRPIRLVLGLPAGGAADIVTRAMAQEIEKAMKQSVIVDNKPGALYQLAVQAVANAPADGHTLLYVNSSFVTVQVTQKRFDLTRQFMPLTITGETPGLIVVAGNSPFKTFKDLVDFGRSHPEELTYGTLGVGTLEHLKSYQLTEAAGFKARAVPYKGGPDMLNGVIGGDISYTGVNAYSALPHIKSGKLRALVVMDAARVKSLPDVPAISETGIKTTMANIWSGFMVRSGTPPAIVQRLFETLVTVIKSPAISERFAPLGILTTTSKSPGEFKALIESEAAWMGAAVKKLDLINK